MVHDRAIPVRNTGTKFAAFVTRFDNCALVQIYRRPAPYEIDFSREVMEYETARNGASEAARRDIRKLEAE